MIKAIIFSNNPKTLSNLLNSIKINNIELFNIFVLYKLNTETEAEFLDIIENNKNIIFVKETNFKEDLMQIINMSSHKLISFFKDTNFFFSSLPGFDIEQIMSNDDVFCFSFALGKNIKHCYHNDVYNILLNEEDNGENTISWNWVKHYLDFGRPLELGAGHTFHHAEIAKLFKKWKYNNILELEASFEQLDYYPKELMSSFKKSTLVDILYKTENIDLSTFDFATIDRIVLEL